jgi:hypothetical protein
MKGFCSLSPCEIPANLQRLQESRYAVCAVDWAIPVIHNQYWSLSAQTQESVADIPEDNPLQRFSRRAKTDLPLTLCPAPGSSYNSLESITPHR